MSSTQIPTASSVTESAVIKAPLTEVWNLIQLDQFSKWWSQLSSSDDNISTVKFTFKDGTTQDVKQEEHSTLGHFVTFSTITSSPPISYSSSLSTVRCYEITSGSEAGSTFVVFSGHFSSDADAAAISDAKYKRAEALADLAKYVEKK